MSEYTVVTGYRVKPEIGKVSRGTNGYSINRRATGYRVNLEIG